MVPGGFPTRSYVGTAAAGRAPLHSSLSWGRVSRGGSLCNNSLGDGVHPHDDGTTPTLWVHHTSRMQGVLVAGDIGSRNGSYSVASELLVQQVPRQVLVQGSGARVQRMSLLSSWREGNAHRSTTSTILRPLLSLLLVMCHRRR